MLQMRCSGSSFIAAVVVAWLFSATLLLLFSDVEEDDPLLFESSVGMGAMILSTPENSNQCERNIILLLMRWTDEQRLEAGWSLSNEITTMSWERNEKQTKREGEEEEIQSRFSTEESVHRIVL